MRNLKSKEKFKETRKQWFVWGLCLCMMLLLPVTVKAVEGVSTGEFTVSGDAGSYSYDADAHTLTITGCEALTISGNAVEKS